MMRMILVQLLEVLFCFFFSLYIVVFFFCILSSKLIFLCMGIMDFDSTNKLISNWQMISFLCYSG